MAAKQGHTETVQFLVDKGADINTEDNAGVSTFSILKNVYVY